MSYEVTYNPSDPAVPNIVTGWDLVDLPTKNIDTINNPDISQLGGTYQTVQPVGNSKVAGNALVPLTDADMTRKRLFDGPASGPAPFGIKTLIYQGVVGNIPTVILKNVTRANIRFFSSENSNVTDYVKDLSLTFGNVAVTLTDKGDLVVASNGFSYPEIYLDIIYS